MAEKPFDPKPSEDNPDSGAGTIGGRPVDYLEIKADPQRAIMTIKSSVALAGLSITREDVDKKLKIENVKNGVDWAMIERMLEEEQFDRGQIIAQAMPPKPGRDASIREILKIDSDLKPVVGKDGKADYKNVDNIRQVKKGDVLAIKSPPVKGQDGHDVFGNPLPAALPKDLDFKPGANTVVSEDGLQLLAALNGYVYHQAGSVSVGVTYVLKGDVDFKTGNLHYLGDIQVMGNVTDGFTVQAEGNILVEGTVEGAEVISTNGSVQIKSGVFGHGKGRIAAKTGIKVLSAQDVKLECEGGDIEVETGLRNCQVLAKNLKGEKPGCSVVGGEIRAYGSVAIAVVGAEGCQTRIRIVDKEAEAAGIRLKAIEGQKAEVALKLVPVETRLKGMKAMLAKFGGTMSERSKSDLKAVVDVYSALKKCEKSLDEESARLEALMGSFTTNAGKFAATEKIVWGGFIELYGHHHELVEEDAKKEWLLASGGLISRAVIPATPEKPAIGNPGPRPVPPS